MRRSVRPSDVRDERARAQLELAPHERRRDGGRPREGAARRGVRAADALADDAVRPRASVLSVASTVDCPFSFALGTAPLIMPLLETPNHGRDGARRSMRIVVGGVLGRRVTMTFCDRPDPSEPGRPHDEIAFSCVATARWLPDFRGTLRFRPAWMETRLTLDGEYVPPFGTLGRLLDLAGGRVFARMTARDVLSRVATLLESRWGAERDGLESTSFGDAAIGPHSWLER